MTTPTSPDPAGGCLVPRNLFTLLGDSYRVRLSETVTGLCPPNLCEPAPTGEGFGDLVGEAVDVWQARSSPRERVVMEVGALRGSTADAVAQTEAFTDGLRRPSTPSLDVLHVLLPHGEWDHLASGHRYNVPSGPGPTATPFNPSWTERHGADIGRLRHLSQLQYSDRLLGGVLDRLEELDAYDDSLVVVVADHGVGFTPGASLREPSATNDEQVLWVPMFVKDPGQRDGEVVDVPVRTIDVLPTIADRLDVRLPWDLDGVVAGTAPPDSPFNTRVFTAETVGDEGLRREGDTLVFDREAGFREVLDAEVLGRDGPLGLYRFGRYGDLVGLPLGPLTGPAATTPGQLDEPELWRDVDLTAEPVPVYVTGTLESDGPGHVAVAVNGVVAGIAPTRSGFLSRSRPFEVLVPEELLVDGANRVELFLVEDGEGDEVQLRPTSDRPG